MPPVLVSSHLSDALAHLRLNHPALLRDVAGGECTLWVGSGVSRDQVPPLEELLAELIHYLQAQPGSRDEEDAHFVALKRIVEVHFPEQFDDFLLHPSCWRPRKSTLRRAVNSYSEILAVEVDGQDDDYLLWDGIDIRKSYGSDSIEAGPDHQLIAMLIRERVVNAVVTTNWDGLIEKAALAASATDGSSRLAVHMTNESFQTERGTAELNKIHGCAVLAHQDPHAYRKYLISRLVDIAVWRADPDFQFVIQRSESLLQTRRSLFLGISVQDYNLLALIAQATKLQPWTWDAENPSYVFAAKELGDRQKDFLKIAYRSEDGAQRSEVRERSTLGMYSGPALAALLVETLKRKLSVGIERASDFNAVGSVLASLLVGLDELEEVLLRHVKDNVELLVQILQNGLTPLVCRYFDPTVVPVEGSYTPIFPDALPVCSTSADFKNLAIPQLAVVLSLVGLGRREGIWEPLVIADGSSASGVVVLSATSDGRKVSLVITRDEVATSAFKGSNFWHESKDPVVLLQTTGTRATPSVRGLARGIGSGRSVGSSRRQAWMSELQPSSGAPGDIMTAFRAEVTL